MSKEVATKETTAVSTEVQQWGSDVNVGKDLLISKVLTMQAMSEMVVEDGAKMGEFRDSLTKEIYGDITKPVAFIPFHCRKMWDIMIAKDGGDFEWEKTLPVVEDPTSPEYNDNWEWNVEEGTTKIRRVRRMDFFCLIAEQIGKGALPVTISFRSTGYKSGQVLLNQMYVRNKMQKKSPAGVVMNMSGIKEKNDKGTFIIPQVAPLRDATTEEQNEAFYWYKLINASNVIVDESDSKKAQETSAPVGDQSAGRF